MPVAEPFGCFFSLDTGDVEAFMVTTMEYPEFELFLQNDSASFLDAEQRLIQKGESALPVLKAFFSGEARNEFGVPYRQFGKAMRCALETVRRLGLIAKPLEPQLRAELELGNFVAAMALGSLGSLDEESTVALAACLGAKNADLSFESAVALIICEQANHPAVTAARAKVRSAEVTFSKVKNHIDTKRKA